jgi:hypothetical protein
MTNSIVFWFFNPWAAHWDNEGLPKFASGTDKKTNQHGNQAHRRVRINFPERTFALPDGHDKGIKILSELHNARRVPNRNGEQFCMQQTDSMMKMRGKRRRRRGETTNGTLNIWPLRGISRIFTGHKRRQREIKLPPPKGFLGSMCCDNF